ncbi:MAG: Ig-like domain-containing protein, partial [Nitrososphaerales archaeon]
GEDADNDGILDGSEDKNGNGILDLGCFPVDDVDVLPPFGFNDGDTDADGNLDPGETWTFECTMTLNTVGVFNNTAFSEGTICLDADCLVLDGIHTGDPACEEGTIGLLCDPAERDSVEVTVEPQTPMVTTQSQPSMTIAPGAAVTDKATVKSVPPGLIPAPTGTVSFFLCGPGLANPANGGGCPAGGTPIGAPVPLNGAGMATSIAVNGATTTPEGKYCWRAVYNGDDNYDSASHTNNLINNSGGECFSVGVPTGKIIIIKDTIPNDPRNFDFTETIPLPGTTFALDDDSNGALSNTKTFSNVDPGTFEVREIEDGDFPLRDIRCRGDAVFTANGGSTVRDLNNAKVTITINGGTVTCTFINGIIPPPCVGGTLSAIQPEDPISMTTVVSKQNSNVIAKTVHAEKQIFDCETSDGIAV